MRSDLEKGSRTDLLQGLKKTRSRQMRERGLETIRRKTPTGSRQTQPGLCLAPLLPVQVSFVAASAGASLHPRAFESLESVLLVSARREQKEWRDVARLALRQQVCEFPALGRGFLLQSMV